MSPNPFQPPDLQPPRRSRGWLWLLVGGVLACLCLCSGMCVVPLSMGVYQAVAVRDDVEQVVTAFLAEMDDGRFEQAAGRFSSRARQPGNIDAQMLARLRDGSIALQDASTAHVSNINISRAFNSNRSLPQGVVANVSGTVDYAGEEQGKFRATLEKEGGNWRLHSINVERDGLAAHISP